MPVIDKIKRLGKVKRGWEIGSKNLGSLWLWHPCLDCGKERWVQIVDLRNGGQLKSERCQHCNGIWRGSKRGSEHPSWKGGRHPVAQGYIKIWLNSDDPFYPMANQEGYVLGHRLVMARHLGRCLDKDEVVHHLNGIRDDNRIKNLSLLHRTYHGTKTLTRALKQRIRELENQLNQRGLWQNEEDKT